MDEHTAPMREGTYLNIWSYLRFRKLTPQRRPPDSAPASGLNLSPYVGEYLAALDRTDSFGFEAPPRVLVKKNCVDMHTFRPTLLDCFERAAPDSIIGQTAAGYFALVPLLYERTGIAFNLTIGWLVYRGKPIHQHDERLIQRFIEGNTDAWLEEGCPFHLWLTSPACEIIDVTFAMNLGWTKNREECVPLIVYQSAHEPAGDSIYHPTLVGPDFFHKTGGVL